MEQFKEKTLEKLLLTSSSNYEISLNNNEVGEVGRIFIEFEDNDPVVYIASPKQSINDNTDLRIRIRKGSVNVKDMTGLGLRHNKKEL